MAKEWTHVRVAPETLAELNRVRDSMRIAEAMHLVELDHDDRDRVSLDQVIRRLLEMRRRHAERRRASAARRRGDLA
jgi:hypothetical protein